MCSVRHYLDPVGQHELDTEGSLDPKWKIQLQTEIQVLTMNLELLGVDPVADNYVENLQVSECFLFLVDHSSSFQEW